MVYKFLVLALLITVIPFKAIANDSGEEASYLINDIVISGLKRTKNHILENPLKKFIGQDASKIDINDIHTAIIETGILEPVSIELEGDPQKQGKILKVEVSEKWTIFPLPVFFINSGGIIGGGLGFVDLNALGLNDKFIIGGMIDSDGWLAATTYFRTPDASNSPGWHVVILYSKRENINSDEKNQDIRKFGLTTFLGSAGLNYQIRELITTSLNLSFADKKIHDIDNPLAVPENGGSAVNIQPGIRIRKNNWDGYFLSQRSIEMGYTYSIGIDHPLFYKIDIEANFEKSLLPGFRMLARAGAIYAPQAPPLFESRPGAVNIDILPQSFSAQNFLGCSAGLEKCILKGSHGTLSILSSYQVVYSDGLILGERIDHGVLTAIRFYLSRIAIPAVGLGVSYNVTARHLQGAFNIGMSF